MRSARNQKTGQPDRDQIFENGDDKVFDVEAGDQTPSKFIAGKRADHAAESAQQTAEKQRAIRGRAETGTAKGAAEDPGEQWDNGSAPGSFRQLVRDQFAEREH